MVFIIGSATTMTVDWGDRIGYIYGLPEISVYGLWCAGILMAILLLEDGSINRLNLMGL
jgi:hypothetical protein